MKLYLNIFSVAALVTTTILSARADTTGLFDLGVSFKPNRSTNDGMIERGSVNHDTAASAIGNYALILDTNFGRKGSVTSTLHWGSIATRKAAEFILPNQNGATHRRGTATGALRMADGTTWSGTPSFAQNLISLYHDKAYAGFGNIANGQALVASDFYLVGNSRNIYGGPIEAGFGGTFAPTQNGDLVFTVIPEPASYAALLGIVTLTLAVLRRRKLAQPS